jgi:hypothetical protein
MFNIKRLSAGSFCVSPPPLFVHWMWRIGPFLRSIAFRRFRKKKKNSVPMQYEYKDFVFQLILFLGNVTQEKS